MSIIQYHPDGLIYVRTANATYGDTFNNFSADFGQTAPALPEGVVSRIYKPGVVHALSDGTSVIAAGDMPWTFGDQAIAAIDTLLAAQAVRNTI